MNQSFHHKLCSIDETFTRRSKLETLQINLGNLCNQRCLHCHVNASPEAGSVMSKRIIDDIIGFLSATPGLTLDITGGCPELNPFFRYCIEKARLLVKQIIVRTNLTVLLESGMEDLALFYKQYRVKLICSMPCYTEENVDKQRGSGVFKKSIKALRLLNEVGYGRDKNLELDLAYNPGGSFLPGNQQNLEKDYKKVLREKHGIEFHHLLTLTNVPINRFRQYLEANGNFDEYMKLLIDNFNRDIVGAVMCRNLLSVGWDGILYDCDFNQALGFSLRDRHGKIMEIGSVTVRDIDNKEIIFENHCFSCTAGTGSSCQGSLKNRAM